MSAIDDIKNAHRDGLPVAAEWSVGYDPAKKFTLDRTVGHIQNGHRLIPSVPLPYYDFGEPTAEAAGQVAKVATMSVGWQFCRDHGLPLILRHDNIPMIFRGQRHNGPIDAARIPQSARVWTMVDGVLRDEKQAIDEKTGNVRYAINADPFGPVALWAEEGRLLGASKYLAALQQAHPNPAWVMFADNNERSYPDPLEYQVPGPKFKPPRGYQNRVFVADLARENLRLRDYVAATGITYWDFLQKFYEMRDAQYAAYFNGFKGAMTTTAWQNLYSVGYSAAAGNDKMPPETLAQIGSMPEAGAYDGAGGSYYLGSFYPSDLLDAVQYTRVQGADTGWDELRVKNPRAFRALFVWVDKGGALASAKLGIHEVIDLRLFQTWLEHLLWNAQEPGVMVQLYHWLYSKEQPDWLFFAANDPTDPKSIDRRPELDALGRPELKTLTEEDYVLCAPRACGNILDSEVLREYWRYGQRLGLAPQVGQHRYTAIRLGEKCLVHLWSPCKLTGDVPISIPGFGDFTVPAPSAGGKYLRIRPGGAFVIEEVA